MHRFKQPADLRSWNTLSIEALQNSGAAQSGRVTPAAFLIDGTGRRIVGDAYPLHTRWQTVPLDLAEAAAAGAVLDGAQAVGVEFRAIGGQGGSAARTVETDTWMVRRDVERYVGQRLGLPKTFYVEGQGQQLRIGQVGKWEIAFHQRGFGSQAWLEATQGKDRKVLGQPGTGLMLLDQDEVDGLGDAVTDMATGGGRGGRGGRGGQAPRWPWPGAESTWQWQCAWTSPTAALVEVRQISGPYDALGRPAVMATWRFTVYQTGQVFACAEWTREGQAAAPVPVTLALVLDKSVCTAPPAEPDALLRAIYPRPFREGVLPHQMQAGSPVMMLAKVPADEPKPWWRAEVGERRFFGCGLPAALRQGPVACTLLVNTPTPLDAASAFSGYLRPAALEFKTGTLDRNFPGDVDNDGLAEPYGFQAIRLQNGRASFVLNPDNRPIFYPAFLLTVPAEDRARLDPAKHELLVNVDGQAIRDVPRWPDGSFVLQLPWIINKAVRVEVELVGK